MGSIDSIVPPGKVITIRYRDKYVDLVSDTGRYGTMTQTEDRVEFDFSECRVVAVRDIPVTGQSLLPPVFRKELPEAGDPRLEWPR